MRIEWATDKKAIKSFIYFPRHLYRNHPNWIPPLWSDERKAYLRHANVMLRDNDHALFVVKNDDGEIVARCIVYIDAEFNRYYRSNIGFFGAYETIENQLVSNLVLETCAQWLRERNIRTLRGPIHPIAESWGFLYDGYESPPVLMAPYNPPYYHTLVEKYGMRKVKDLYAYEADLDKGYRIPQRIERFTSFLQSKHPELSTRRIRLENLTDDAQHIWSISNEALKDNWGYVPVDRSVMNDMINRLKLILDPDAVWFVEDNGKPVGFALGFPDPNPLIRQIGGHLLPTGFIKLLRVKKTAARYRLFALAVLPQYHGYGLDVLLYKCLHDALEKKLGLMEANYILEDNWNIRNALEKLQMKYCKTYRIYEMDIASS